MATLKKSSNTKTSESRDQKNDRKRKTVADNEDSDQSNDENDDYDDDDEDDNNEKPGKFANKFANDGSFLEMFKKMQEQQQQQQTNTTTSVDSNRSDSLEKTKRKPKVLKVGIIEKKKDTQSSTKDIKNNNKQASSAWNQYMNEVRAYKDKYGDDEDKNRPLVK